MERMPTPMPAEIRLNSAGVGEALHERRRDHRHGEEAEHDARDAGEHLEDRLEARRTPGRAYSER